MNKQIKIVLNVLVITVITVLATGCQAPNHARQYGTNGAILGAIAGGVIGHQSDHAVEGAIVGAAAGAGGGYIWGNEKDKGLTQAQINAQQQQINAQRQQPVRVVQAPPQQHRQPQPPNVPRQVVTRDSQWVRQPNGEYGLQPILNTTNIYGDVNVGGSGGYRRPPPRRSFPIPRCF